MMQIDLRPHYAFAYSVESMEFGSTDITNFQMLCMTQNMAKGNR